MSKRYTIAVVNNERGILQSLTLLFEAEGYAVRPFSDTATALDALVENPADIAILDYTNRPYDGVELLRRLRNAGSQIPVIYLSPHADTLAEMLVGARGVEDFIASPFSARLVVERVRSALRRVRPVEGANVSEPSRVLERGKLRLDPERHTCQWDGHPVMLTVTEFLILQALATRPGVVKTRDALMDAAYDDQVYVDDRTIDMHIKMIRKRLLAVDPDCSVVETLYGVGYRFRE